MAFYCCGVVRNSNLTFYFDLPATLLFPPGAIPLVLSPYLTETMQFILVSLFVLSAVPAAVFACEGECIIGITNAFLGNFSSPIQAVLDITVSHINPSLISTCIH